MTATTLHRILYVEDEPDIQAVAQLALEAVGGFTVKICSSGQEALGQVEDFAPDLILLDVMMPAWMAHRPCKPCGNSPPAAIPRCAS